MLQMVNDGTGLEGLWAAEFVSSLGVHGAGVGVFETRGVYGEDAQYYYTGTLTQDQAGMIDVDLTVTHYAGQPGSIFGTRKELRLKLRGKASSPTMALQGHLVDDPTKTMTVRLRKLVNLP